ncbi:MAG TPA: hypothetical protein VGA56_16665 [Opitutaceae bacterium]
MDRVVPIASAIVGSGESTPEWTASYRVVRQLFTQGLRQQMADTQQFGRKLQEYRDEVARLSQEVAAERETSQARMAHYRGELLSGLRPTGIRFKTRQCRCPAAGRTTGSKPRASISFRTRQATIRTAGAM